MVKDENAEREKLVAALRYLELPDDVESDSNKVAMVKHQFRTRMMQLEGRVPA